ncbi:hypothetical protein ACFWN2_35340 [Lentzea sp. NPDC058436]|uniref:hypothetical protein n=1 Tax=Lentzea sp. NPDC058436 TaxID=3346499 RepID=UPI00364E3A82
MRVADLVELAGFAGVAVWLKMDGERATHRWTVILTCPSADFRYRRDVNRFEHVLKIVRDELAKLPGDWSWLGEEIEDLDEFAEHYEELGRRGAVVIVDGTGEQVVVNAH